MEWPAHLSIVGGGGVSPLVFRGLTGSQRTPGFGASQDHSL